MKARAKRTAKAILGALGAGASAALVAAQAGAPTTREWLSAIGLAFVTGVIVYRVPNAAPEPAPTPPHERQ